jgi:hypothetical protein
LSFVVFANSRSLGLLNASEVVIDLGGCLVSLTILVSWAFVLLLGHRHITLLSLISIVILIRTSFVLSIIRMHSVVVTICSILVTVEVSATSKLIYWVKRSINFKNSFDDSNCFFSLENSSLNVENSKVFNLSFRNCNIFQKLAVMFGIFWVQEMQNKAFAAFHVHFELSTLLFYCVTKIYVDLGGMFVWFCAHFYMTCNCVFFLK